MELTEKAFQVLDALDRQEISTQRQLAELAGVSLGQVNYVLKSLLEKGLVKIGNFRKSQSKIGYVYLLTPKGIEAKSRLGFRFVMARLTEYDRMRRRLAERLAIIENKGHVRVIFVGPPIVKEFVDSIIKESTQRVVLVGHCSKWEDLKVYDPGSFDIVLLFDGNWKGARKIREATGISPDRLLPLV
ncbi:MAG: MarR family EPS-associated transcriptional regulator [Deltaproteobacteria bacterium]|jgi:EPS-associated MarR family transcriptional regulator|nr:MAG: MarR family EPS-associated transcriptional regulator [Deltaproteobacteria bacterium]